MPPNRYARPEVLKDIRRLKAALHREGDDYRCEPDPPGMWGPEEGHVSDMADWMDEQQPTTSCQIDTLPRTPPT